MATEKPAVKLVGEATESQEQVKPPLRPLAWIVVIRVDTREQSKRLAREWIPQSLWPKCEFIGKEVLGQPGDGRRWWNYRWGARLSQTEFDLLYSEIGFSEWGYEGETLGILDGRSFRGIIPAIQWMYQDVADEVILTACPFPAEHDTVSGRAVYRFEDWDEIKAEVEAHYGCTD